MSGTMVLKAGGPHDIHGGKFDYRIAQTETELQALLDEGWSLTTGEAMVVLDGGGDKDLADDLSGEVPRTRGRRTQG